MKVNRIIGTLALWLILCNISFAQKNGYFVKGDYGITIGTAQYFGDLNATGAVNDTRQSLGIFFRKQFNDYIGVRVSGTYAQLTYNSTNNSNPIYQKVQNLSFYDDVYEFAVQGDFNFFKFNPLEPYQRFTPYITLGLGVLNYSPYVILSSQVQKDWNLPSKKQALRELETEEDKSYTNMAISCPLGVGFKFSINKNAGFFAEAVYRFTNTDYLDDVSKTYIGYDEAIKLKTQPIPSIAYLLQDPSTHSSLIPSVTNTPVGYIKGTKRGDPSTKDAFVIAQFGITWNIGTNRCPPIY